MCRLVRSVIIVLLGLSACSGQDDIENYANNGKSAVVSTRNKDQDTSILKQIHRHNEDGSYTYGYEGSDGSFKIETKTVTGEVSGKYGYVDDLGKLRVVEYGANKYGFQPAGDGITVPSPTLVELRHEDDEEREEERNKRPSPVSRPDKHAFVQHSRPEPQPQLAREPQRPAPNAVRTSAADFDDYDSAGWTVQSAEPQRSVAPKPAARPRPAAGRFGGNAVAVRPKSSAPPPPPVGGSFRAAPEVEPPQQGPSGSYQTVQAFDGGRPWAASRSTAGRPAAAVDHSYDTFEDQQEPETEPPAVFQAVAKPARRNGGGTARPAQSQMATSYRSAPRQMRTSGILDQLAEQYALPESGSPVAHSVSFGLDQ